jgi:hypothetical protein
LALLIGNPAIEHCAVSCLGKRRNIIKKGFHFCMPISCTSFTKDEQVMAFLTE